MKFVIKFGTKRKGRKQYRMLLVNTENGKVLVSSPESYYNKGDVLNLIDMVKSTNDGVPVEDLTAKVKP